MKTDLAADISCKCSKCRITVSNGRAVQHFLCACEDCRQALQWCHIKGGDKPDPIPDLYYVSADIITSHGKENMGTFKLRDNGRSTRLYCKNCYSLIAVDHPSYKSNILLFFPKHCKSGCDLSFPPTAYIFMDDYSEDIGPFPTQDIPLFHSFKYEQERKRLATLQGVKTFREPRGEIVGTTFSTFLETLGPATILNLEKGKNLLAD